MAETLVLANLSIDSDGSVRGIAKGVAALRRGEQSVDRFGQSQVAAGKATQGFLGRLNLMPGILGRIGIAAGIAAAAFAAWRALTGIIRSVGDALSRGITLAGEYERNAVILTQTVGDQADEMLRYADALQRATQFTDDQIVPAMVQLANITGATGDELKELTQLTLDVAVTFNRNLNDSAILVAKSAQGVTDRLNELGFTIDKSITGKAERGAAALALLREKTVTAQDSAQTYSGTLARLSSVWDSLLRNLGNLLTESGVLREALNKIVTLLGEMSDWIATINSQKFNERVVRPLALGFGAMSVAIVNASIALVEHAQTLARLPSQFGLNVGLLKQLEERWNNQVISLKAARAEVVQFFAEIAAGTQGFTPEGPPTPEPPALPLPETQTFEPFAFAGIASPAVIEEITAKATEAMQAISVAFQQGAISEDAFSTATENLRDKILDLQLPADQLRTIFDALGISYDQVTEKISNPTPWENFKESLVSAGSKSALAVNAAATAMNQFGNSLAQAFLGKETNFKKFMAEMLASMVPVLTGFAAIATVRGLLGEANQFATAGYALAAAAAVGAAARALGAGRESGGGPGGGRGGRPTPALAGAGGGGQTVNVFVQGSLLGTDPNELARSIAKLINTNRRDGSF